MGDSHTTSGSTPATGTASATHDVIGHVDSPPMLFVVFGAVIALFFATLGISVSGSLGKYALVGQLLIATVQASLVAYYFMHLRHGDRVVVLAALASIFWMGILFVLFMSDYMTRARVVG